MGFFLENLVILFNQLYILGPSKKKAKHNAALSILSQMMGISNGQAQMVEDFT